MPFPSQFPTYWDRIDACTFQRKIFVEQLHERNAKHIRKRLELVDGRRNEPALDPPNVGAVHFGFERKALLSIALRPSDQAKVSNEDVSGAHRARGDQNSATLCDGRYASFSGRCCLPTQILRSCESLIRSRARGLPRGFTGRAVLKGRVSGA